jgi:hypothetical protein
VLFRTAGSPELKATKFFGAMRIYGTDSGKSAG